MNGPVRISNYGKIHKPVFMLTYDPFFVFILHDVPLYRAQDLVDGSIEAKVHDGSIVHIVLHVSVFA